MTTGTYFYDRAPSEQLRELLAPGGFLRPIAGLREREVAGLGLDVHLRADDEVHVYCGLARLMRIRRNRGGTVNVSADLKFRSQACAEGLIRTWRDSEAEDLSVALDAYLGGVKVDPRHIAGEGEVQSLWARVTEPWVPFDREAVLGGEGRETEELGAALAELEHLAQSEGESPGKKDRWSPPPSRGREIDQLAVDPDGRLVLLELKDASKGNAPVYYAPFQLLQYVWEWHDALECVRGRLQALLDARVTLGLAAGPVPRLTGGIRAAVCFGAGGRTDEVRRRYGMVLDVANRHLPPCVPRIETWALQSRPEPVRLTGDESARDPHRLVQPSASLPQPHPPEGRHGLYDS